MKKTVNRFDYPTAATHTFKMYRSGQDQTEDVQNQKQKYKEFSKQQRQLERQKVKEEQNRKRKIQQHQEKMKIQAELEGKRKQLEKLQKAKQEAIQYQKRSHELAIIKEEADRKRKIQEAEKAKQNKCKAQNRFMEALQRMQYEKEEKAYKEKQAELRRKVANQTQKVEREKAAKYRDFIEQQQKNKELPDDRLFDNTFKKPLGRTVNGTVDYAKTRFHNPQIIIPNNEEEKTAIERALEFEKITRERSEQKKRKEEENMKKSIERGEEAIKKMQRQKQYQKYERENELQAKKYNLARIQAGKKNQLIGLKPGTLSQMEANKKIRSQQQFEKMFMNGNPQWYDRPATKYQIVEEKFKSESYPAPPQNHSYPRNPQSKYMFPSQQKYSFEEEGIDDLTTVKKDNPHQAEQIKEVSREQQSPEDSKPLNAVVEYQNRRKNGDELSYSESEEDSQT